MSNLTSIDRMKLEKFLEMNSGYVLDFYANATFFDFILENTDVDVDQEKYEFIGTSKAKRLRAFWEIESNDTVAKLIFAFLERWKTQKLVRDLEITSSEQILFDECFQIAVRLKEDKENCEEIDDVSLDSHFDNIPNEIIDAINSARFTIWIAVAWFTDKEIFNLLVNKKNQGVNVQLIIMDDDINQKYGLKYEDEFETYRIKEFGRYKNIMHNKFCILDIEIVIQGSYNWTNKAKYNKENITVVTNRENAKKFTEYFIQMKKDAIDCELN
ncbi:MAG: phospholipase D-like domain-containing protein [Calothrix sp. MO_167.B42]|nr:phospholipase D-like domain-containing protein [Calothrix sp. MO_167.B42]